MSLEATAGDRAERMRALLDQCEDPVLALDLDGCIVFANCGAARAAGAAPEALLGRRIGDTALFGADAPRAEACVLQALHDGSPAGCELRWERAAGEARTCELRIDVDRDAAGAPRGLLVRGHDVTQRRRIENDLRHREREFRTLAENSPDAIIRYGPDLRAVYCNREIEERVTVSAMRVVGRTPAEAAPPGMGGVAAYEAQLARTLATGERGTVELLVPHPDGQTRVHSVVFEAERDAAGTIRGALAVGRDVTEQVRIRQALAAKEREFRSLAENAGDNIVRWAADGRMVYVNPAMLRVVGVPLEHLLGRSSLEAFPDRRFATVHEAVMSVARDGHPALVELRFAPDNGRLLVHQIRLVPEPDEQGRVCSVLGIGRDITEKIEQIELIESLVRTDALTGLGNRRALEERALALLAASARHGSGLALMLLDLDEFKSVNDAMGHSAGDRLLCEVARRLAATLRANDLLVRLGGDEFVVLVPDIDGARGVAAVAAKLHAALAAPFSICDRAVSISASLGVALHPDDGEGLEALLAHADSAMYQAKRGGRGGTAYYRRELSAAVQRRLVLEESMRAACEGEGLVLHFQPQVCLQDAGQWVGAEALLRWQHPTLGLLAPDAFIPLAEETGLIAPIGRWVLETAARAVAGWNRGRSTPLTVSVNVSTRQFALDRLPCLIDEVLARTGCAPGWLVLEITESALLEDSPLVQRTLEAFRARGVQVALDDFGTGYSALNYLARFHVDCLKIDKSFVQAIGRSERDGELVKAFIAMADALKLTTLAEGIETDAQAAFLVANGCRLAQGYRFGRPMPAAQFERELPGLPPQSRAERAAGTAGSIGSPSERTS